MWFSNFSPLIYIVCSECSPFVGTLIDVVTQILGSENYSMCGQSRLHRANIMFNSFGLKRGSTGTYSNTFVDISEIE